MPRYSRTIYEIAKEAKVSIATVSRAMNQSTRSKVATATLRTVDAVIKRHHYAPNLAAKGLTSSVFHTVGVVVPHGEGFFVNEYYTTILGGVADALLDSDYRFKLMMLKCQRQKWDKYNFRAAEGVDGLIIAHRRTLFANKSSLRNLGVPCVVIGDPESGIHAHFVSADQGRGGRLAAEYLYEYGHRHIAIMAGGKSSVDSQLRMKGFKEALCERNVVVEPDHILHADFQEERAERVAAPFLKKKPKVSAIFCFNDAMAFGVIHQMRRQGLRCPDDLSVVGFDDAPRSKHFSVPLTTVRMPIYDIAMRGADDLIAYLEGEEKHKRFFDERVLLPVSLIERQSVRRLS